MPVSHSDESLVILRIVFQVFMVFHAETVVVTGEDLYELVSHPEAHILSPVSIRQTARPKSFILTVEALVG